MELKRDLFEKIQHNLENKKILILYGARQVGKTYLMNKLKESIRHDQTVFILGEDLDTQKYFQSISSFEFFLRTQKIDITKKVYIFIDEFHNIKDIDKKLKLFYDSGKDWKFVVSGSNAFATVTNLKESMAGRVIMQRVFALSYKEYLRNFYNDQAQILHQISMSEDIVIDFPSFLTLPFEEFVNYGSLPEVLISRREDKVNVLENIIGNYLRIDVRNFVENYEPDKFNYLFEILASQISSLLSINNLSENIQIPYRKTKEYLYLLREMFIINLLRPYSTKLTKEINKSSKIYFEDTGVRNFMMRDFYLSALRADWGYLVENFVFNEFEKFNDILLKINFWRTKQGSEIDFILRRNNLMILVEVKSKSIDNFKDFMSFQSFEKIYNKHEIYKVILHTGTKFIKDGNKILLPVFLVSAIRRLFID